jgi:hypothetical protein
MTAYIISVDGFLKLHAMGVSDINKITCEQIERLPEDDRISIIKTITSSGDN